MRRHLSEGRRLEPAALRLLVVVVLMLSLGTVYMYAALVVDLPRASSGQAFGLTAALVVSVTCLKILRDRQRSREAGSTRADRDRAP